MPEPLKNLYNPKFLQQFAETVRQVIPSFDKRNFLNETFNADWEAKELKGRIRHIASILKQHLTSSYKEQTASVIRIIEQLKKNGVKAGLEYMFFPDFIEQYGFDDLKTS